MMKLPVAASKMRQHTAHDEVFPRALNPGFDAIFRLNGGSSYQDSIVADQAGNTRGWRAPADAGPER